MKSFLHLFTLAFTLTLTLSAAAADAPKAVKGSGEDLEKGLPPDFHRLAIGDAAPDFKLPGIDGKTYTLADFKAAPLLMVVFLSNHCPYSHAAETRLLPFVAAMKPRGLAVVAINPNHPDAVGVGELGYSKYNDSFDEMKLYAKDAGFTFPYLYDGETQVTAKAYGCLATPHVFVFDRARKLRYAGRFDDSRFADAATVTSPDTRNAVEALLAGKPVPVPMTRPMGCSTKWLFKKAALAELDEKWTHEPVTLETIDAAGVAALAQNKTEKVRVINVWATWCAPCVQEFPALVALSRRLNNRDFEIVTISIDDPKEQPKVLKFLEARHAEPHEAFGPTRGPHHEQLPLRRRQHRRPRAGARPGVDRPRAAHAHPRARRQGALPPHRPTRPRGTEEPVPRSPRPVLPAVGVWRTSRFAKLLMAKPPGGFAFSSVEDGQAGFDT